VNVKQCIEKSKMEQTLENSVVSTTTKKRHATPLFCLPTSKALFVDQRKQKRYSMLAGVQNLVACCIMVLATFPGHTFGWSFFLPDIRRELKLSRTSLATMWGISLFLTACILPLIGKLLHQYGQFFVVLIVSPLFAFSIISVSFVNSWLLLGIAFFILRLLGPGILVLSSTTTVSKWFKFYRGKASLIVVAFSFFMIVVQKLVSVLIQLYKWRGAYVALGIITFFLLMVATIFLRDEPEKYYLSPDLGMHNNNVNDISNGDNNSASASSISIVVAESTRDGYKMLTYKETLNTFLFWSLIFAQSSVEFAWCGMQFYLVDILRASKPRLEIDEIANAQVVGGFFTMFVVGIVGFYIDSVPSTILKYVMVSPLILGIAAILFLKYGTSFISICSFTMLLGAGMGINDLLTGVAYSTIFSKKEISKKLSIQLTLTHIFVGFGPFFCGILRDLTGSYDFVLWSYIVVKLICIVCIFIAPLPDSMQIG
jgi:MFS transporter, OFA family, oxalate/formate antiporter